MLLLIWSIVLATAGGSAAHKVVESTEDVDPATATRNITTLYPVKSAEVNDTTRQKTATSWKIETTFGASKLDSNSSHSKEELVLEKPSNSSEEFRPSQHLGNFLDEGFHLEPTRATPDYLGAIKKPPTGFISSLKDSKFPKEAFKQYHQFPYKFDSPILTRAKDGWKPAVGSNIGNSLESHPTDEAPVRVPAGGLYKAQDPFKVRPGTTDEDFGLDFASDAKEHDHHLKKRGNPWKGLVHLLTALIPVGIIFSALTPNVITIEPDHHQVPGAGNIFRRADGSLAALPLPLPPISERCRRRLLCELHSDTNYPRSSSIRRGKQCQRIHCEDPEALTQSLRWLLSHKPISGQDIKSTIRQPHYRPNGYNQQRPTGHVDSLNRRPTPTGGLTAHPVDDSGDLFTTDFT